MNTVKIRDINKKVFKCVSVKQKKFIEWCPKGQIMYFTKLKCSNCFKISGYNEGRDLALRTPRELKFYF